MSRLNLLVLALATFIGISNAQVQYSSHIDTSKLVDLTYSFDQQTVYWPTAQPFRWEKETWGDTPTGWYAAARFSSSEHGGTHLDSPIHFAAGKQTVDQIPADRLVGPAIVIDIMSKCDRNPDYLLSPADIQAYEKSNGPIPPDSIVLIRTGWGRFWPDRKRYLGTDKPGDVANLHFPGISPEAARFLRDRRIRAVGIDTASIDYGQSKDFRTHRILAEANVYGLENVANLDKLPAKGATLIALPMKIAGGSGAPVRIIALLP